MRLRWLGTVGGCCAVILLNAYIDLMFFGLNGFRSARANRSRNWFCQPVYEKCEPGMYSISSKLKNTTVEWVVEYGKVRWKQDRMVYGLHGDRLC